MKEMVLVKRMLYTVSLWCIYGRAVMPYPQDGVGSLSLRTGVATCLLLRRIHDSTTRYQAYGMAFARASKRQVEYMYLGRCSMSVALSFTICISPLRFPFRIFSLLILPCLYDIASIESIEQLYQSHAGQYFIAKDFSRFLVSPP